MNGKVTGFKNGEKIDEGSDEENNDVSLPTKQLKRTNKRDTSKATNGDTGRGGSQNRGSSRGGRVRNELKDVSTIRKNREKKALMSSRRGGRGGSRGGGRGRK